MTDRASKALLDFLNLQPNRTIMYYDLDEVELPAEIPTEDDFFAIVRHLEKLGYVEIVRLNGVSAGCCLSHVGANRDEFSRMNTKAYWKDKWIAIAALIISIAALIKSFFFI